MEQEKGWYVLHTYSGYENKVKENLDLRRESMDMENNIFRVVVPVEEKIVQKDGEDVVKTEKSFPGYVLVEMIMSDEAWFIVRNTPGVTGFVGSSGGGVKPFPLLDSEVEEILNRMEEPAQKQVKSFNVGDRVEITGGAFAGMEGVIEEVDTIDKKVNVLIEMFGRETVTELDFDEVDQAEI